MSAPKLLIHPVSQRQLEAFQQAPSHALLLVGPAGSGKFTLALQLAENILKLEPGTFGTYSYGSIIRPEAGNAISIEAVRTLEHFLSLKIPGKALPNRLVIVEDSHLLTIEAQNALLKTLEEPVEGTVIILTAHHPQALLPTIRSRVQTITIHQPEQSTVESYFAEQGFETTAIHRALAITGGLPGLMQSLLSETDHPLLVATEKARTLLSQPLHKRLLSIDELSRDRPLALGVIFILGQMARHGVQHAKGSAAQKWQTIQRSSYEASEALRNNGQSKLILLNLVLHL
jgi:hypothetical protein